MKNKKKSALALHKNLTNNSISSYSIELSSEECFDCELSNFSLVNFYSSLVIQLTFLEFHLKFSSKHVRITLSDPIYNTAKTTYLLQWHI